MPFFAVAADDMYPVARVPDRLPEVRPGCPVSPDSVANWCSGGLRGGTVRLRSVLIGGRRHTCDAWLAAFFQQLNDGE